MFKGLLCGEMEEMKRLVKQWEDVRPTEGSHSLLSLARTMTTNWESGCYADDVEFIRDDQRGRLAQMADEELRKSINPIDEIIALRKRLESLEKSIVYRQSQQFCEPYRPDGVI